MTVSVRDQAAVRSSGQTSVESAPASVTYDDVGPTLIVDVEGGQPTTTTSPVTFVIGFDEPVATFDVDAVTVGGTTGATLGAISPIEGGYSVTVNTPITAGTVVLSVADGAAVDAAGNPSVTVAAADTVEVITPPDTPEAPIVTAGDGQVTLSWSPPTDTGGLPILGYLVEQSVDGGPWEPVVIDPDPDAPVPNLVFEPAVDLDGFANDVPVELRVSAVTELGEGPPVTSVSVTPTAPPRATVSLAAGQASPTSTEPVVFDVEFDQPVSDFGLDDLLASAPAGATAVIGGRDGEFDDEFTVSVSGMTSSGTVELAVAEGSVVNANGQTNVESHPVSVAFDCFGSDVVTVDPARLLDTRGNGETVDGEFVGAGKVQAGTLTRVQIAGRGGVPADAVGVELNITGIQNEGRGFATLYPCSATRPTASTLNYTPGVNIANATTVALNSAGEVCLYSSSTAHYALDVVAYVPAGSDVVTVDPARLLDTRGDGETVDGEFVGAGKVQAGTLTRVQIAGRGGVPGDAVGVELNITGIQNEGRGFATLYPCTATRPTASTLNYTPGVNIANATTVALNSAGEVCLYSSSTAHFALDVVAYIAN